MKPFVSIFIPAFNASNLIAHTLKSAIGQTWQRKEIIVVDDGSTDKMLAIARQSIGEFIMRYNRGALIEWISHRMPAQVRVVGNWGIGPTHTKA